MSGKIDTGGVLQGLYEAYQETLTGKAQSQHHLSNEVLIERIKRTVYEGAMDFIAFYKQHALSRSKELAAYKSALKIGQRFYSKQSQEARKKPEALEEKTQALKTYWILFDTFYKVCHLAEVLKDASEFLAPSSIQSPIDSTTGWLKLKTAAKKFCEHAEKADAECKDFSKQIRKESDELSACGKKTIQEIQEEVAPNTLQFLKLFENWATIPRDRIVNPVEETKNADMFLKKWENTLNKVFKQTETLYNKERSRLQKVEEILQGFKRDVTILNNLLQEGKCDLKDTESLERHGTLLQNLSEYLREEVCKIGTLAAQLKLIGKLLGSTQPLKDFGDATRQDQLIEYQAVKKVKESIALANSNTIEEWSCFFEVAYVESMHQLECAEISGQTLKRVLQRFLAHKHKGWVPLTLSDRGFAWAGRVVGFVKDNTPNVYEDAFWAPPPESNAMALALPSISFSDVKGNPSSSPTAVYRKSPTSEDDNGEVGGSSDSEEFCEVTISRHARGVLPASLENEG